MHPPPVCDCAIVFRSLPYCKLVVLYVLYILKENLLYGKFFIQLITNININYNFIFYLFKYHLNNAQQYEYHPHHTIYCYGLALFVYGVGSYDYHLFLVKIPKMAEKSSFANRSII